MGNPHVLAIPYPAQGHVIPLLELAQCLAKNDIKVTFVNSEFNHGRIEKTMSLTGNVNELLHFASIPDGLEPWEDRNDLGKLSIVMPKVMPAKVEALIAEINKTDSDKVTCVITDCGLGWALELAQKLGIKRTSFLPASVGVLALAFSTPKLIEERIIDDEGIPLKQTTVHLSPEMPPISTPDFPWSCIGDPTTQKAIFHSIAENRRSEKLATWLLCNSSHELEPGALKLAPKCVPIGPLLASNRFGKSQGHFWLEDSTTLSWLDQQPQSSVIYIAFGSFAIFNETQFQQLALGLELTNRPFLWVVRQDMTEDNDKAYPIGFKERVKHRGKMVAWAPQQKVLSHPSIACFLSHCGWNSTVEGVSNGVPYLCWPYFADQFLNRNYICDYWGIGLGLEKDERGIVGEEEIRKKVELLLSEKIYKNRAVELQSKAMASAAQGGSSHKNFSNFVDWIKEN